MGSCSLVVIVSSFESHAPSRTALRCVIWCASHTRGFPTCGPDPSMLTPSGVRLGLAEWTHPQVDDRKRPAREFLHTRRSQVSPDDVGPSAITRGPCTSCTSPAPQT